MEIFMAKSESTDSLEAKQGEKMIAPQAVILLMFLLWAPTA
jgi:hypothetical protein